MKLPIVIEAIHVICGFVLSVVLLFKHKLIKQYQRLQLKVSKRKEQISFLENLIELYRKQEEELEISKAILQDSVNALIRQWNLYQRRDKVIIDLSKESKQVISEGLNTIREKVPYIRVIFWNRVKTFRYYLFAFFA